MFAGAAASSFVAIAQLATLTDLTDAHHFAIGCFAVAMPVAAGLLVWPLPEFEEIHTFGKVVNVLLTLVMIVSFGGGIVALLYSFGKEYAVAFGVALAVTLFPTFCMMVYEELQKQRAAKTLKQ